MVRTLLLLSNRACAWMLRAHGPGAGAKGAGAEGRGSRACAGGEGRGTGPEAKLALNVVHLG